MDITDAVKTGVNTVAVRVAQWSTGSDLKDQDQSCLPGVVSERRLRLPPAGSIEDLWFDADRDPATGEGYVLPELTGGPEAFPVRLRIPDLGVDVTWATPAEVTDLAVGPVAAWSAENPVLHETTVSNAVET